MDAGNTDKLKHIFIEVFSITEAEEKKAALKPQKKDAVAEVKMLIVDYKLTKDYTRGKALKQLMGE